jgi:hypothetical protein
MKRLCVFAFLAFSLSLSASPMLRVVAVKDARTIVVDNRGVATDVTLAQVIVPPHEEEAAAAYLRQSLVNSWVMIESDARGGSFVYRSPDAMFVNGALAQRVYANGGGVAMTYVGEVTPGPQKATPTKKTTPARAPAPHRAPHRARRR